MKTWQIAVLPGDGIGPEVTAQACHLLHAAADRFGFEVALRDYPIGATAVRSHGQPLPELTRDAVTQADAVLLGAVGDPSMDGAPRHLRPETGLLQLRALLGVYANLRPVAVHPALADRSPLKADRLNGVDLLIVRELTGGLYYGEPRGNDGKEAINTLRYSVGEIERVARVAFESALGRRKRLLSVDKANVLETSQLWRETVTRLGREYPDVILEHIYVDYAAMRLVSDPGSIDVLVTENMFGDILSDEAGVLVGSLGLLPSASIGGGAGLFEPIHGSAPTLAGQDVANPIGAILSAAMLLRHGLRQEAAATAVERAVALAIVGGARSRDLCRPTDRALSTRELGRRVAELVEAPSSVPAAAR